MSAQKTRKCPPNVNHLSIPQCCESPPQDISAANYHLSYATTQSHQLSILDVEIHDVE